MGGAYLDEQVAVAGARDPRVVELPAVLVPVHRAAHGGALRGVLVHELEHVLDAQLDVIDEDHLQVLAKLEGLVEQRLQRQVPQHGEALDAVVAVAAVRVDEAGLEEVHHPEGLHVVLHGLQHLPGAVAGAALDDGDDAVLRPQEADGLERGGHQPRQHGQVLVQVEGEHELDLARRGPRRHEALVAREVDRRALQAVHLVVVRVEHRVDVALHGALIERPHALVAGQQRRVQVLFGRRGLDLLQPVP